MFNRVCSEVFFHSVIHILILFENLKVKIVHRFEIINLKSNRIDLNC